MIRHRLDWSRHAAPDCPICNGDGEVSEQHGAFVVRTLCECVPFSAIRQAYVEWQERRKDSPHGAARGASVPARGGASRTNEGSKPC